MATFTGADKAIGFLFDMVSNIADDYDATSTYAVNDYAIYNGVLYKCTSNILVAEDFTPAHWSAVLVMDEISAGGGGGGSTTLAGLSDVFLSSIANGDVLTYDNTLNKWKNAAGGGGGGHLYSTSEHVVGTWIDNTDLYERTFVFTGADMNGTWTISNGFGTLFYLPYGDEISQIWIDVGNSLVYSSTSGSISQTITFPVALGGTSGSYVRSCIQRNPSVNNGKMVVNFQTTFPSDVGNIRNNLTYIFTFRYTKTTV